MTFLNFPSSRTEKFVVQKTSCTLLTLPSLYYKFIIFNLSTYPFPYPTLYTYGGRGQLHEVLSRRSYVYNCKMESAIHLPQMTVFSILPLLLINLNFNTTDYSSLTSWPPPGDTGIGTIHSSVAAHPSPVH